VTDEIAECERPAHHGCFIGNREALIIGEEAEVIAACALCPNEDCGALIIGHRWAEECSSDIWEFTCSRCGVEFSKREEELIFQFVPLEMVTSIGAKVAGRSNLNSDFG